MALVPYVVEQTSRGERSYDIYSRLLNDRIIAGNFFICGFSGEKFCSLTDKQLRHYEKLFRDPELFLPTPIGIMPMKCTPDQYKRLMQERNAANREER